MLKPLLLSRSSKVHTFRSFYQLGIIITDLVRFFWGGDGGSNRSLSSTQQWLERNVLCLAEYSD